MTDFDFVEDVEEVLHPLCLCINHDSSRIGVGHQQGYIIYQIHRSEKESEDAFLYTSVESVYPPHLDTADSVSLGWDLPTEHSQPSHVKTHAVVASTLSGEGDDSSLESTEEEDALPSSPCERKQHLESEASQIVDESPRIPKSQTSTSSRCNEEAIVFSSRTADMMPTENGVGVMALLCRTRFVAVVGGGPYPIGPRNVVKLFVAGALWADYSFSVVDDVEALHIDHRLIIILTTAGLRLHSFETRECLLFLPNTPSPAEGILRSSSVAAPFSSGNTENAAHFSAGSQNRAQTSNSKVQTRISPFHHAPIIIDYARKCLCYRSSPYGFSLVRYDTETGVDTRLGAKVLATVSAAHTHVLTSLAMDLSGDGSGGTGKRWLVASCSEWATLIRIWQYCDMSLNGEGMDHTVEGAAVAGARSSCEDKCRENSDYERNCFVMVKEVRNAATPTPIFQLMFLGESFLSCIACNRLKIFFVGEREKPKPYDISTKDPTKVMRAKNHCSSLHHLSLVSSYFSSEWAACECPLPLSDGNFLPKWVGTTMGALRQHLLCNYDAQVPQVNLDSSTMLASGVSAEATGKMPSATHPPTAPNQVSSQPSESLSSSLKLQSPVQEQLGGALAPSWGGMLRNYVTSQMVAPVISTAGLAAMWYMGSSGSAHSAPQPTSLGTHTAGADSAQDCFRNRDYATMTDIAQALVVWWEKPAYWQLECMTKPPAEAETTLGGKGASMGKQKNCTTILCCVTCDGSALRFNFDPIAGTISCSKTVATVHEKQENMKWR